MNISFYIRLLYTSGILILLTTFVIKGQGNYQGSIEGRIYNANNNEPVPFANIVIWGTNTGSVSDLNGKFTFTGLKPGFVELRISSVGFKTYISEQIQVTNAKKVFIEIPLQESNVALEEVKIEASPFRRSTDSPVSLRRIGIKEIEKNPGGNRDISKVIQSFPGVASTPAYRNDIIVRGGGASENRFYLDGVEIPNLNHFATQGASGGPVGIINVDFIREVNFYSGAFPADRGNALSSVLDMRQIDGNKDKLRFKGAVGASDLALTLDGPVTDNTTFILSARRSYLQFLFAAIGLPFLPTYNDFQFKTRTRINEKNEFTLIGLGAIDQFALNLKANKTEDQRYILNYLPVNEQWNYTIGGVYKHFRENGYDTWVLSRNYLNNRAYKYRNNNEDSIKLLDYYSTETENKFRYERNWTSSGGYDFNAGTGVQYGEYYNSTYRLAFLNNQEIPVDYSSRLGLISWSLFGQVSHNYFNERLTLSLGLRADANDYSSSMSNMLKQLSPRFSASWALTEKYFINFNTGRYYQRPPYTSLGYKNNQGILINKENDLRYISADHLVAGLEYRPNDKSRITLEGFYKHYLHYPFSVTDSISLASKGADFGTFGDEEVLSISKGRAYGLELLGRSRDLLGFNVIFSYTLVRSEFKEMDQNLKPTDQYIPTSWDNRHIINLTATRNFKNNWNVGFKWRFVGGAPYTPYDLGKSSIRAAWDSQGRGFLDYSMFNQYRLNAFHQLDVRIDKEYFFNKWSLNFYVDVQNLYNFKADEPSRLTSEDKNGQVVILNPDAPYNQQRYKLRTIQSDGAGTVLPTLGIIVEF
ncbi:MAG TPA: TonB-dependent receptor [Bacteroidales bacterium]|nr:TonB-dependent receptor [Bacteroidales bacterium]